MICGIITGPTHQDVLSQMKKGSKYCQIFEIRVDLLENPEMLLSLDLSENKWILTCRRKCDGGLLEECDEKQKELFIKFSKMSPSYIDIDACISDDWVREYKEKFPHIKVIRSLHTNDSHDPQIASLARKEGDLFKLACHIDSADAYFGMRKKYPEIDLLMGMGDGFEFTRMLQEKMVYAPIEKSTVKGQILAQDLVELYGLSFPNQNDLFGLIGTPLHRSLGYLFHNQHFRENKINASYLNFPIGKANLSSFIDSMHGLPKVKGLSVTSPLKEDVLGYLDEIDKDARSIGAVNTIVIRDQIWKGYNTDGIGAMKILPDLKNRTVAIMGSGGTAKAIAYHVKKNGGHVSLFNRTKEKIKPFANELKCSWGSLDEMKDADIVINATTSYDPIEKVPDCLIAFDVNYGESGFIKKAKSQGAKTISGENLFYAQAKEQLKLWNLI